jgi:hypothetical protein
MKKLISLAGLALVVIVGSHISGSISPSANEVLNNREVRTNVTKMLDDIIAEESQEKSQGELMYIVSDSYLKEEPAEDAELIADLNVGAEVLVLGEVGEFKEVEFFGAVGYVYSVNIADADTLKYNQELKAKNEAAIASMKEEAKNLEIQELKAQQDKEVKAKAMVAYKSSLSPLDLMVENIELEGTDDESLKSDIKEYFSLLPESLITDFNNSGWSIIITTKDIASNYYNGKSNASMCGLTLPDTRHIVYEADSSKFRRSILHEFAHCLDASTGFLTDYEEFQKIYQNEKDSLKVTSSYVDSHYKENSREFFAEAVQEFLINPDGVKASSPQAYKYISDYLEKYL